jgi:hypothetical protein
LLIIKILLSAAKGFFITVTLIVWTVPIPFIIAIFTGRLGSGQNDQARNSFKRDEDTIGMAVE